MPSITDQLEAKREKYDTEGAWQRFLLESFLGSGGYQGRIKQPPAGWWGSAAEAYSGFSIIGLLGAARGEGDTYLDRHPREDAEKFSRRKNVAHYLNYVRPTTALKVSYIVRKPHVRNGIPERLKEWIEATGYDAEFKTRALRTAVLGWWPMLVDMPAAVEGALTAAQSGKLDPYTVAMLPCQLYDYELDQKGKFVWAKLVTTYSKRPTPFSDAISVKRYVFWTRTTFSVWESESVNGDTPGDPKEMIKDRPHPFGAVPLVSWRAETSVEDTVKADSVNADIVVEARRLFNVCSEFDEYIRGQAFAILVIPTRAEGDGSSEVGVENGLRMDPESKHVPFYLAPPADLAVTFETRIERSIIEIYRMARVEYDRATGTRSSAQSKENNFEQTNLAIADFAGALAVADRETLIIVGRGLGCSEAELEKIECTPHATYETQALNDEIEGLIEVLALAMGNTFKSETLKRLATRVLPNLGAELRQKIESEIEAAVEKAEKEQELTAQAERDALNKPDPEGAGEGNPGDEPDEEEPAQAAE